MNKKFIPAFLYCVFIFYLSSQKHLFWIHRVQEQLFGFRTSSFIYHIIKYAILGVLLRLASNQNSTLILFTSLYGITDEIHQWFVPFRFMSPYDMLANTIGGVLGIYLVELKGSNNGL